jgi:hypothetical protein
MDCSGVSILSARDRDTAEQPCADHDQPQEKKPLPPIQKFEANFFSVHWREIVMVDPFAMTRIL